MQDRAKSTMFTMILARILRLALFLTRVPWYQLRFLVNLVFEFHLPLLH